MVFMMFVRVFQICGYRHLQTNLKMREGYGGYVFPTMSSQQDKYIDQSLVTNKEEKVLVIQWKCKYIYALHLVPF
jgi:hypothetical protein